MKPTLHVWLISFLVALPSVAAAAGKYGWFSDRSAATGVLQAGSSTFGMDVYRSGKDPEADVAAAPEHKVSLYGDYPVRAGHASEDSDSAARRFANFGVRWQHRVSVKDSVSVSAEQGESSLLRPAVTINPDAFDTRATASWTRELSWAWKPSVTGGVFLGDEASRNEALRSVGRRYYGFTVGGELRLLQAHTPYVSFRMERSLYDFSGSDDSTAPVYSRTTEDSSRFAAGWRWRATRGLSLQAEASYGFNFNNGGSDLLSPERERSRVFFGTRFDFR
jgi:hypothetical protein